MLGVMAAVVMLAIGVSGAPAVAAAGPAPAPSQLVGIQAAHHPGFDRIVFKFSGSVPSGPRVEYVSRLLRDPSARAVSMPGRSILRASFYPAVAHGPGGRRAAPARAAFALPNIMAIARAGDFESVVSYGIGLAKRTPFHTFTLTRPSRVVIDIETPFRTVLKGVYFFNQRRYAANTAPFVTRVVRPVPPGTPATGMMDRLFAGPTATEFAAGLRLLQSQATGFSGLVVNGEVARIRLTGGCASGGSTVSIADEIFPTLKQLPNVKYVKVSDPSGQTETPTGLSDSRPLCLEP
jgi:hypothetical protein